MVEREGDVGVRRFGISNLPVLVVDKNVAGDQINQLKI